MSARTVKQWYDLFTALPHTSSHNAAGAVLGDLTDYRERAKHFADDLDQLANAMTAWRMLPTTTHEDPTRPWYNPLPHANDIAKVKE